MVEGRRFDQWWHTGAICSTIANVFGGKKNKPYTAADFHPLYMLEREREQKRRLVTVPIDVLKTVFIDGKVPNVTG